VSVKDTYTTATVEETPMLMMQWLDNVNYRLENSSSLQYSFNFGAT